MVLSVISPGFPPPSPPIPVRRAAGRAIHALILREIATAQGRAPGGYLWAVAEPVAALALLAGISALAFPAPPLGRDFVLFYASGYLPFMFYTDLTQKLGTALRFSRPLLAYPGISWIDALIARLLLAALTHLVVITLVLGGALLRAEAAVHPDPLRLAQGLGLALLLGTGIGTLNALLFGLLPIWERIWAIVSRPMFLISGVLFLPEAVPPPYGDWLLLNPLVHVIALTRAGIYGGYDPAGITPLAVILPGLIALALALALLRRQARGILAAG